MKHLLPSLAIAVLLATAPARASASDQGDAVATVHLFIDNMAKNDMTAAAAAFMPEVSIIDEFPPYHWAGAAAMADWGRSFGAFAQKNGVTEPLVSLGEPAYVEVTGDAAYAAFNARYDYKQAGKPVREDTALMTFALTRTASGWRISGWAWTRR
jgi:ketosteroid isomerase-like protein